MATTIYTLTYPDDGTVTQTTNVRIADSASRLGVHVTAETVDDAQASGFLDVR
jgi:hypothetical protein